MDISATHGDGKRRPEQHGNQHPASIGVTDATLVLNITATNTAPGGNFQADPSQLGIR